MNKVILMGRLVDEPNTTFAKNRQDLAITRYTLAVQRKMKSLPRSLKNGQEMTMKLLLSRTVAKENPY